jgi:hypothetical protein
MAVPLRDSFKPDPVPSWVLAVLRQIPKLTAEITHTPKIRVRLGRCPPEEFELWSKARISTRYVARFIQATENGRSRKLRLLATRRLTPEARSLLQDAEESWIESETGVCHIQGKCLYVHIAPEQKRQLAQLSHTDAYWTGDRPTRLTGKSGVIVETLLVGMLPSEFSLDELATEAGVSKALVSRVLSRLTEEELVENLGSGPTKRFVLADPPALLDLWALEDPPLPDRTTGVHLWARSPTDLYRRVGSALQRELSWAMGGVAAANLYAPTLTTPPSPSIWLPSDVPPGEVTSLLGGNIVDQGANLTMWQSRGDTALHHAGRWAVNADHLGLDEFPLVSRPRAYVEALAGTGRSEDVARNLRGEMKLYERR